MWNPAQYASWKGAVRAFLRVCLLFILASSPAPGDEALPRLYVRLLEPTLAPGMDHFHCARSFRFALLVDHERPELCGAAFGLTVRDPDGELVPGVRVEFTFEQTWRNHSVAEHEGESGYSAVLTCFGPFAHPPSKASPIGEARLRFSSAEAIRFQLSVEDPAPFNASAGLVFSNDFTDNVLLVSSDLYFTHCPVFIRGDANDDARVDISDVVTILGFLFLGEGEIRCEHAADANNDGMLEITDPIYIIQFLFLGGAPPPPPFPDFGEDADAGDTLACEGLHPLAP
jgi:hypothetical protein